MISLILKGSEGACFQEITDPHSPHGYAPTQQASILLSSILDEGRDTQGSCVARTIHT